MLSLIVIIFQTRICMYVGDVKTFCLLHACADPFQCYFFRAHTSSFHSHAKLFDYPPTCCMHMHATSSFHSRAKLFDQSPCNGRTFLSFLFCFVFYLIYFFCTNFLPIIFYCLFEMFWQIFFYLFVRNANYLLTFID